MKMSPPGAPQGASGKWTRFARHLVAGAALLAGASMGWAQNAVGTYAGTLGQSGLSNTAPIKFNFSNPSGVAVDSSGNLYLADTGNNVIRKVTTVGVVSTFAGSATGVAGNGDGTGTAAFFNAPEGIAIDSAGTLYVADTGNHAIRMVTAGGAVTTLAGTAGGTNSSITVASGYTNDTGTLARFHSPLGITVDSTGTNVYVADTLNNAIRQVVVASKVVTTLTGSATGLSGNTNGTGTAALFSHPDALVASGSTLYVADTFNNLIRKIVITAGPTATVTTLAGTGTSGSYTEGTGPGAQFSQPSGIAVDGSGNVLVSDTFFQIVRSINASTGATALYAGTPNSGGNTDGTATQAKFNFPSGVAFSSATNSVFVVDSNNQEVRRVAAAVPPSITGQPSDTSKTAGQSASFTVTVAAATNPTPTYQWQRNPGGNSSFSNISSGDTTFTGATTATLTIPNVTTAMSNDKFQVIVSNLAGNATSNAAQLTVPQAPAFTSASSVNASVGQVTTFTVTTSGSLPMTLSQTGNFPPFGGFTDNGNGTATMTFAPASASSSYTFTISAANSVNTATQSFTVTVSSLPVITTQPQNTTVSSGNSAQFTVVASGATAYQWYRQAGGVGGFSQITDNGLFAGTGTSQLQITSTSQPMNGDQYEVVVTNAIGNVTSSVATLTIAQAPQITSLPTATFVENVPGSFQIQATGSGTLLYSINPALPGSLSLGVTSGTISGTPTVGSAGSYTEQITVSNGVGTPATQAFTLVISNAATVPTFTTQPASVTVAIGQAATFTVAATGSPAPTYQWQRQASGTAGFVAITDNGTYSGTTTTTLTVNQPVSGMSGDQFVCVATNSVAATTSQPATLNVVVGTTISTLAGQAGFAGSTDATGTAARFNNPTGVAIDSGGNLYIADSGNSVIRKITASGVVTTLAGTAGVRGSADGTGAAASFNAPSGVAVDGAGNVYVADTYNHTIREISPAGVVTTLAGTAGALGSADGTGSAARFYYPSGIAVDSSSTVYVADTFNQTIRRITNGVVSTFAGTAGTRGSSDSPGLLAYPAALAVDSSGFVYVADSYNNTIRRIAPNGVISTLAGQAGITGAADGTGNAATFNQPSGITVDAAGNAYVADTYNNTIRKVTSAGVVTTLAGVAGQTGTSDGTGTNARFAQPFGIASDSVGNLYIADTHNHTIRRSGTVTAPVIVSQPSNAGVGIGGTATFTVVATGSPTPSIFQWMRQASGTSGFVNLSNDGTYSGVNTATLTISNVTQAMNGDQFEVVVSNLISPTPTSSAATLAVVTPPAFTSGTTATFTAGTAGSFTVAASGSPNPTYSATGLPTWASLDGNSGVISGTPPDTSGSPYTVTITANNGASVSQTLVIVVNPAVTAPSISNAPSATTVNRGQDATLSVSAGGTGPFTYQWFKDGVALTGATNATLTVNSAEAANSGNYTVTVSNSIGSVTSSAAAITVNTDPVIKVQPTSQTALAGSSVTFSVTATGTPAPSYQWTFNGNAIGGANSATYTVNNAQSANAGNYAVMVSNSLGAVTSSLAQLTVATAQSAPVFTLQPASMSVVSGSSLTLTAAAQGAPAPSYQWFKNGAVIANANSSTYAIGAVQGSDAANYTVTASNSAGSVTSGTASVTVFSRSYKGEYFGTFGSNGSYALHVRADNSAVFLGFVSGANSALVSTGLTVNNGQFAVSNGSYLVTGSIANDGTITGSLTGLAAASLTGSKAADVGSTQGVAGFYEATATNSSAIVYGIFGAAGQGFVLTQSGNNADAANTQINSQGSFNLATSRSAITGTVTANTGVFTASVSGSAASGSFSGGSDSVVAAQRLTNLSSRAFVGTGGSTATAGFVITGQASKTVLIRAVGPTLTSFGLTSPVAAPRLDLNRVGTGVIASNTGWTTASNSAAIASAASQYGAFALANNGDSAILTTLAPGNYTAVVTATTTSGVGLIEVYDLSAPTAGQKLFNISTLATTSSGQNVLSAGIVIAGSVPKRVLVRGVGPTLTSLGVTGALNAATLTIRDRNGAALATNSGWSSGADANNIAAVSAQAGAFALTQGSQDAAMIISLAPGNYTAEVTGQNGATGVAIVEVYELP